MINIQKYFGKLADNEKIEESEIVELLNELKRMRVVASYLASCQAGTLESLPKSASASSISRHKAICTTAYRGLSGDMSGIAFPERESLEKSIERCISAVNAKTPSASNASSAKKSIIRP